MLNMKKYELVQNDTDLQKLNIYYSLDNIFI